MKKIIAVVFTLGLMVSAHAFANAQRIDVTVKGMLCSVCVKHMERRFKAQDSVQKISVDLKKGVVHVVMKDGKTLSDAQVTQLVGSDPDYSIAQIQRR